MVCESVEHGKLWSICQLLQRSVKFGWHILTCKNNCISSSLGVNFDFFGIGEFWGCKSLRNDFGLQYRFFYYKRASLIGGVALKAGHSLLTVMTIKSDRPRDSPIVRYVTNIRQTKWLLSIDRVFCFALFCLVFLFVYLFYSNILEDSMSEEIFFSTKNFASC